MSRSVVPLFLLVLLVALDQISKFVVIEWGLGFYKNYGFFFGLVNFGNPIFSIIVVCLITCVAAVLIIRALPPRHSEEYDPKNLNSIDPSPSQADRDDDGEGARDDKGVGLILFLSGAVSNLIDRLGRGYVVDFLDWKTLLSFWPTGFVRYFNLADVFIVVGLTILILHLLESPPKRRSRPV